MNPDVLGYIFEKYINQKAFGAYYTRPEITEYLSERTIYKLVLDRINTEGIPGVLAPVNFKSISDLLMNLNADLCRQLLHDILPKLSILDPACGSGAFLVAAMKTLINLYSAVVGRIEFLNDRNLKNWLAVIRKDHPSINYFIKKKIITDNLYGVDIMEEATEIAKLRLFLALVASASSVDELEPLPNIDFNIMAGNSLVGLLRLPTKDELAETGEQQSLFQKDFHSLVADKNRLVDYYRHAATYAEDLRALRANIETMQHDAQVKLDSILLERFKALGIRYEEATWDEKKNKVGKPVKRALKIEDILRLKPFHWGFEFSEIMEKRGGFDAVVTNPPWEIFKLNGKEFFEEYSALVTKKKMSIKEFEKEQGKILKDKDVLKAWRGYLSEYPYVSEYYRSTEQYKNQISIVNGKKSGTDINLYKLFTEQCFNLIKKSGKCGIVIPSEIYTDLGTKRLREMLFEESLITGLFCFENRKEIFENVDSRFKFVVLTYRKGDSTKVFPARFMRHEVAELERFPENDDLRISIDLVKKLSPDSVSIMEFKNEMDVTIAKKMLKWPLLGEEIPGKWKISLSAEFHMTNDSHLFKTEPGKGRLPLYEGKMIHQFENKLTEPRYWIDEKDGRNTLTGRTGDTGQTMDYQLYRVGFRDIARNTDMRTMICTVLSPANFMGNTINYGVVGDPRSLENLILQAAILNSFSVDFYLRFRVTAHCNFFIVYTTPVPRLTTGDRWFKEIVERAAHLICTTPEFDDLAREVGLAPLSGRRGAGGEVDPTERAKLRAELDGIIAHLYELTEEEFAYILTTFPLVSQPVKDAALEQFRAFAPKSADAELLALIKSGESHSVEFKETARWDVRQNQPSKVMEKVILETVAAFMNAEGGNLIIGVKDDGSITGLGNDYQLFGKKENLRDTFENWLTQYLLINFGKDVAPSIRLSIPQLDGKDVCKIAILPAPRAVFVKDGNSEQFFIRTGNSKKQLSTSETVQYCKQRWPS